VRRSYRTTRNEFFVNFAGLVKERSIDKRSAAKFERADLSPFDRNQRGNGFITGIQKPLSYELESDASRRKLDASIFAFAEEGTSEKS
jgi:hypothetical protein